MPAKKRPGVTGVYVEISDDDVARLDALVAGLPLGNRADHLRLALKRHLDNPPTVEVPPLPPLPPVTVPAMKKSKGKK